MTRNRLQNLQTMPGVGLRSMPGNPVFSPNTADNSVTARILKWMKSVK